MPRSARCFPSLTRGTDPITGKRKRYGAEFKARVALKALRGEVQVSMDGRDRWMDNVFIHRPWRSLEYECVHQHAFETGSELRAGPLRRIGCCNVRRPHSTLAGRAPDEAYGAGGEPRATGTGAEKLAA